MGKIIVSTFSRLFFIRSFLYLQVTRTCIKSLFETSCWQVFKMRGCQVRLADDQKISVFSSPEPKAHKVLLTRTGIKAWSSLILGQTRRLILELLALEWRKFHTFKLEYLWSQLANLDQILCVASLGWGKGCIRFWGRLILAHWSQVSDRCPLGYLLGFLRYLVTNFWRKCFSWHGSYQLPHDKINKMICAQQRLRSAWASAQSDQSLHCALSR